MNRSGENVTASPALTHRTPSNITEIPVLVDGLGTDSTAVRWIVMAAVGVMVVRLKPDTTNAPLVPTARSGATSGTMSGSPVGLPTLPVLDATCTGQDGVVEPTVPESGSARRRSYGFITPPPIGTNTR